MLRGGGTSIVFWGYSQRSSRLVSRGTHHQMRLVLGVACGTVPSSKCVGFLKEYWVLAEGSRAPHSISSVVFEILLKGRACRRATQDLRSHAVDWKQEQNALERV